MKIDHFAFEVSDLDRAIHFYVDQLGFKLQYTFRDENEHEALAILEVEGGKLELIQVLGEDNQPQAFDPIKVRKHFCPHIALQVGDLGKILEQVKSQGLNLIHGPLEMPGMSKWLYICDPDKNVIEFFQDLEQDSE